MVSEQSPLLPQPAPITNPNKQLALICAVRFIDPLTFTQIFPYINQFLLHLHIIKHKSQIGFYSGLVESTFAFFQLCTIYHWAWLSDNVGRRPVILICTFGLSLTTTGLGLASSLPAILLARCLAGVFSGNAAVLHAVVGEITSPTNQAFTFPVYGLFWPLGNVVGPLIGGALANPADEFPSLFDNAFFRDYPYFLPCFATGLVALVVGFATLFFLEETLPSKRPCQPTSTSPRPEQEHDTVSNLDPSAASNVVQLLRIPVIRALSVSGAFLCFTATAFDALFVIFCYTPIALGGLNFSASQIGYSLSIAGVSSILLQILFLPTLLLNVNHSRLYNICMGFWPLVFLSVPLLNIIARNDIQSSGKDELTPRGLYIVWIGIAVIMIMSRIGCLAYSISLVLVKQNTPSPHVLGKTNAIVLWAMCVSRALAPAFVSSFFALSIDKNLLGGFLWLVVMVFVAVLGCLVSLRISHSAGYNDDESEAANESLGEIAIIL